MNTQRYHFQHKKENNPKLSKSEAMGFFQGTQERVRNSCGKRAISVRATEGILYMQFVCYSQRHFVFHLFLQA